MTRVYGVLAAALATVSFGLLAIAQHGGEAEAAAGETVTLSLGDRIRLEGTDVGCRVTRVAGQGKRVFVDCRRAGRLKGTYGTYFGQTNLFVVRYVDSRTARVVFQARHERSAERCR